MSSIQKTIGIVLSVIKYSDTSKIANVYTKDFGRLSLMIKGGRQKQSKNGLIVDPLNLLELVFYHHPTREIQTLSEAVLINHFQNLREDFDRLKFGLASVELVYKITMEHEVNQRMFNGISRILERIDEAKEPAFLTFLRFYVFVLEETGFEINLTECSLCNASLQSFPMGFTWQNGFICNECLPMQPTVSKIDMELFNFFTCLKLGKAINLTSDSLINRSFQLLERFAAYHMPELKQLNALKF